MQPDWEIWLDTHISPIIAKWLQEEFAIVAKSAYSLELHGLSDIEIYHKAKDNGNVIIVSKDSDLDQIISLHGSPPKLVALKIGNCDNRILFAVLKANLMQAIRMLFDFNKDIIEIYPNE
jgi:predicted nuclease of predicted toxin-antitoxin system